MLRALIAVLLSMLSIFALVPSSEALDQPSVSARSAILIEATTRKVLYYKSAHTELAMASTTKIMTALVSIKYGKLDDMVTVCDEAYGVEGSSIYLQKGERITLRDLLYGLLLRSGNDAAIAIAVHIGGSVEKFCDMMNSEAQAIGAMNTRFANPNGLPQDGHYTTAYDLAIIAARALEYDSFKEIASTKYYKNPDAQTVRTMQNKNKLLFEYDGAIGIKTGYTKQAGKCLVFSAERDGMTTIGVVLDCPDMFPDAVTLLDYGFKSYSMYTIVRAGDTIARVPVSGSEKKLLELHSKYDITIPVKKDVGIELRTHVDIGDCVAPIRIGDVLGRLTLYDGSNLIAAVDLVSRDEAVPYTFEHYFNGIIGMWI